MNTELISFIISARRENYDDYEIRGMLLEYHWPKSLVDEAFLDIKKQEFISRKNGVKGKVKTIIHLDKSLVTSLESRAKKNLFSLQEQIEDILRRSVIGQKKGKKLTDTIDDKFIGIFSRKNKKF